MTRPNWRFGLIAALIAATITLPFTGPVMALLIGLIAGLYMAIFDHMPSAVSAARVGATGGRPHKVSILSGLFARQRLSIFLILFILSILLPLLLNRYHLEITTLAVMYVTLAIGLNYIVGLCGLLALGYIAFYAMGAYTYALLNVHFGVNFFLALPLGVAAGAIAGALIGLPVLRLRGDYLAIVTLGFGEIVRILLNNLDEITAGPNGIMGIARPSLFGFNLGTPGGYYYLALMMAALAALLQLRIIKSKIGRGWEAIRDDELAAAHAGVPVFRMKMLAMTIGGAIAGGVGALFAARMTHVSPESFTFLESVLVLCMVVLGGMGSVPGAILGAFVLIIFPELMRGMDLYRMLAFGILMVLMMRFRRDGVIPARRMFSPIVPTSTSGGTPSATLEKLP